jgi:N-acetylglucosamine-6-phosphate deacetylase
VYYEKDGTLIGSRMLIKDIIARVIREHALPVPAAVAMASANPLRFLGMQKRGILAAGMLADVSVFDKDFESCQLQLFEGEVLHSLFDKLPASR